MTPHSLLRNSPPSNVYSTVTSAFQSKLPVHQFPHHIHIQASSVVILCHILLTPNINSNPLHLLQAHHPWLLLSKTMSAMMRFKSMKSGIRSWNQTNTMLLLYPSSIQEKFQAMIKWTAVLWIWSFSWWLHSPKIQQVQGISWYQKKNPNANVSTSQRMKKCISLKVNTWPSRRWWIFESRLHLICWRVSMQQTLMSRGVLRHCSSEEPLLNSAQQWQW